MRLDLAATTRDDFGSQCCFADRCADQPAMKSCTVCPRGAYCPVGGLKAAKLCPAGRSNGVEGAVACSDCPKGKFASEGKDACTECESRWLLLPSC